MDLLRKIIVAAAVFLAVLLVPIQISFADIIRVTENVNLRAKPSTDADVIKLIPGGREVSVKSESGGWSSVVFEGETGYVKSEFIEVIKSSSASGGDTQTGDTASAGAAADGALRYGSEGAAVRALQIQLTEKGVYTGPINSKFGPLTEEAVMLFQQMHNLEMDGTVGEVTRAKLNERPAAQHTPGTYRNGDEGEEVKNIQKRLKEKGVYTGPENGRFGPLTEEAVRKFQQLNGLEVDGIVGSVTLELLNSAAGKAAQPATADAGKDAGGGSGGNAGGGSAGSSGGGTGGTTSGTSGDSGSKVSASGVELLDWQQAKAIFTIGVNASVYDVRTGITYNVRSFSNGKHADVEPVTVEDTELLKKTYGGRWGWSPRPVWVTINGRTMAASINGMPHGGGVNDANGMDGQVCIHFRGSTTHNGNKAFAQDHQDGVTEAWSAAGKG